MPVVRLPDGKEYNLPDGATPDQILAFAKQQLGQSSPGAPAAPAQSVSERAAANLDPNSPGAQQFARAQADAQSDINTHIARAAGPVVAAVPFMAIPAGLTGLAAYGAMAAAGATGGLMKNEFNRAMGSRDTLKGSALMNSLGIDTLGGVLGQGTGAAAEYASTKLLPRMVESAANRTAQGGKILDDMFFDTRQKLFDEIAKYGAQAAPPVMSSSKAVVPSQGTRSVGQQLLTGSAQEPENVVKGSISVPVGPALSDAIQKWESLPKGADALGRRFGGGTKTGQDIMGAIQDTLSVNNGSYAMQPLDGLIRIRSSLNAATRDPGLSGEERKIFTDLSNSLDGSITKELNAVSPEAVSLYQRANELGAIRDNRKAVVSVAEKSIMDMFNSNKAGMGIGAYAGYRMGGIPGAVAGAAVGPALEEAVPYAATWALQRAASNPKAAAQLKAAVQFATMGRSEDALATMTRAFATAGVRDALKSFVSDQQNSQPTLPSDLVGTSQAP